MPSPPDLARLPECTACPDLAATRHSVVAGQFPPGARLLLVGEAPGREEDETGLPFVGRAGRLLDELLADAGAPRAEVAVTNVVKCRPPGNRAPTRAEVGRCRGWLDRQVHLAAPLVVLTLGTTAAGWAFGRPVRLADVREGAHLLPPAALLATYHPSAALRFGPAGAPRAALAADLRRAVRLAGDLAAGALAIGPVGPALAAAVHRCTTAAFATLPPLDPPSGVFRETVPEVAGELAAQPAVAAYRQRRLVAVTRLAERDGALWMRRFAVTPQERRRGVGRELAGWVHGWAVARGYRESRVGIRTALPDNLRFWRALGYRPARDHGFWVEYAKELG